MKQQTQYNSVEKALKILMAFEPGSPVWGVRELSSRLGFSPATVQRLLQTLKADGFVAQDERTRQYRLGSVYYRFVQILQNQQPLSRIAMPVMQELLGITRETVHLNVIQGDERVCISTLESSRSLKAAMPVGSRSPLYAGASSKCLLAHSKSAFIQAFLVGVRLTPLTDRTPTDARVLTLELETIRRRGYAVSLGERNKGLGSLSAPVFDHDGLAVAALSLALPEIRFQDAAHRRSCLNALRDCAARLSENMGYPYPVPADSGEKNDL